MLHLQIKGANVFLLEDKVIIIIPVEFSRYYKSKIKGTPLLILPSLTCGACSTTPPRCYFLELRYCRRIALGFYYVLSCSRPKNLEVLELFDGVEGFGEYETHKKTKHTKLVEEQQND